MRKRRRDTSMALTLPLELQQQIFQYLDPWSFYASRNVCRYWKYASRDAVTLANQLGQLPIEPTTWAKKADSKRRESVYDEAARALMLGMRVKASASSENSLSTRLDKSKLALSKDGKRAVSLHERTITHYDLSTPEPTVISTRPINDLRTAIGGGPWFKCAPTAMYELALSSDGRMLAIALERTIQIYDLSAPADSWPVSSYITSATGHYIAALDFEHNDSLLRVQLSNKGVVVYLGSPQEGNPGLEHWQDKGGLKHAFLDASKLALPSTEAVEGAPAVSQRLAGLQLLRPFANGWLVAAQKHATNVPSGSYCLAYVPFSQVHGHVLTAERAVTILEDLPVHLSEHIQHLWHDLPSAHINHPHFALSPNHSLLAMSENDSTATTSPSSNRVFLYRLPSAQKLMETLKPQHPLLQKLEPEEEFKYQIKRLPTSLGSISGKVLDFTFESVGRDTESSLAVTAVTETGAMTWTLLDN
ncbi:hypothetical protein D6D02_04137 [Aureobasidium pullulans]|uniref:F-box domain-containing protein n=1 Tax=Aureobasidium pullulans TaxID=5580 RepID=A0A4S8WPN9_AURPU|nr:hypothetical protein D6D26_01920 [Aureobasidium pullulans]THW28193.1 hypothetical protein D6D23_02181 [Aureobasidium pullulans]THW61902.1 hypothetical protein D6D20_04695 [Aureobasidium pullulans]THY14944.1 hypothetical protein D6D02_04137 [Aureobasidium pullulans]THY60204.1 hypothetical protein D6C97_03812 [Aureobasidium pullulans]